MTARPVAVSLPGGISMPADRDARIGALVDHGRQIVQQRITLRHRRGCAGLEVNPADRGQAREGALAGQRIHAVGWFPWQTHDPGFVQARPEQIVAFDRQHALPQCRNIDVAHTPYTACNIADRVTCQLVRDLAGKVKVAAACLYPEPGYRIRGQGLFDALLQVRLDRLAAQHQGDPGECQQPYQGDQNSGILRHFAPPRRRGIRKLTDRFPAAILSGHPPLPAVADSGWRRPPGVSTVCGSLPG